MAGGTAAGIIFSREATKKKEDAAIANRNRRKNAKRGRARGAIENSARSLRGVQGAIVKCVVWLQVYRLSNHTGAFHRLL
jgi:hypothetical protein